MCEVPNEAKKTITGGRLNGMTDIKPIWRIQILTKLFGPCGLGWKTKIIDKQIIEGANGEKIATMDIQLFVKYDGEWSEPIEGTGGSSFISNESKGAYTSDECFKMAYTDALSVACRSLGIGAEVYWGASNGQTKYDFNNKSTQQFTSSKPIIQKKASSAQVYMLKTVAKTKEILEQVMKEYKYADAEDILAKDVNAMKDRIEQLKAQGGAN